MRVLVQSLEKFGVQIASFPRAHHPWHTFDPRDELYAREVHSSVVYFTREQLRYVYYSMHVACPCEAPPVPRWFYYQPVREVRTSKG